MNPWINYHHLYYFKIIAEEGSISKASHKLKVGQPALSAQLKIFEDTIGIKLFERKHKLLILTEAGELALEYANEIFRMGSEMLEVLHDKIVPTRPHVQFGSLDSIPKQVTLEIAKAALSASRCTVSLLEGSTEELLRELMRHKIDILITNFIPKSTDDLKLYTRSIAKFPVAIYGSPKYKKLIKNFPYSLQEAPFIMPTKHSKMRLDVNNYLKEKNISVDTVAETQDTALQKLFGFSDLGLIPLPEIEAQAHLKDKSLIEIGKIPGVFEEIFMVSYNRKIENPVSSLIMRNFSLK